MARESKSDEAKRTSEMRSSLFRYRSEGATCDREFADVLSNGLSNPHLRDKPKGHDYPRKG